MHPKEHTRGAWVAQSTLAQVMISHLVSSSPLAGPVLTAQNLEPASDSVSPSLSAPPSSHSVSLSKINKHKKHFQIKKKNTQKKIEKKKAPQTGRTIIKGLSMCNWSPRITGKRD